jgi:hypothetical protein
MMEWELIQKVLAALEREGVCYAEAIRRRFNLEES